MPRTESYIAFREAYRQTFERQTTNHQTLWNLTSNDTAYFVRAMYSTPHCENTWRSDEITVAPGDEIHLQCRIPATAARDREGRTITAAVPNTRCWLPVTASLTPTMRSNLWVRLYQSGAPATCTRQVCGTTARPLTDATYNTPTRSTLLTTDGMRSRCEPIKRATNLLIRLDASPPR